MQYRLMMVALICLFLNETTPPLARAQDGGVDLRLIPVNQLQIVQTVTSDFLASAGADALAYFRGQKRGHKYSRRRKPRVRSFASEVGPLFYPCDGGRRTFSSEVLVSPKHGHALSYRSNEIYAACNNVSGSQTVYGDGHIYRRKVSANAHAKAELAVHNMCTQGSIQYDLTLAFNVDLATKADTSSVLGTLVLHCDNIVVSCHWSGQSLDALAPLLSACQTSLGALPAGNLPKGRRA